MQLKNKVAIITGGTSGIGEATAIKFANEGARVVITGRNKVKGEHIAKQIRDEGKEAIYMYLDIKDEHNIEMLINQVIEFHKRIDILFNNAGFFPESSSLTSTDTNVWNETMNINIKGVFLMTKYAMPYLEKNKGVILNNASVAGMQSYSGGEGYAYSSSKAAVIQFTKMLAKNFGAKVRVNCICPGVIDTPIYLNKDFSRYNNRIPMKRVGYPNEIANVVNFLVSDEASYINGAILTVDGGLSI